jgi:hypothetical protein
MAKDEAFCPGDTCMGKVSFVAACRIAGIQPFQGRLRRFTCKIPYLSAIHRPEDFSTQAFINRSFSATQCTSSELDGNLLDNSWNDNLHRHLSNPRHLEKSVYRTVEYL